MNNDYNSPAPTPEPANKNATPVQIQKENNDFFFLDKSNDLEVIFPKKHQLLIRKRKKKENYKCSGSE
ncbi:hypothetical protein IGJ02_002640 [Enterococcus sp. DIV0724b]|uniref:hypothetical protein n=1 Tax=Enterococcus sp. DIV0724b TaxID=2774694 RepID=UPI003D2FE6DA